MGKLCRRAPGRRPIILWRRLYTHLTRWQQQQAIVAFWAEAVVLMRKPLDEFPSPQCLDNWRLAVEAPLLRTPAAQRERDFRPGRRTYGLCVSPRHEPNEKSGGPYYTIHSTWEREKSCWRKECYSLLIYRDPSFYDALFPLSASFSTLCASLFSQWWALSSPAAAPTIGQSNI